MVVELKTWSSSSVCRDALHARARHVLLGQDDRREGAATRRLQRDVQPGEVLHGPQSCRRKQLQAAAVDVHHEAASVLERHRTPAHHRYHSLPPAPHRHLHVTLQLFWMFLSKMSAKFAAFRPISVIIDRNGCTCDRMESVLTEYHLCLRSGSRPGAFSLQWYGLPGGHV